MVTAREIRETLDERPELEPVVRAALDADEPFAFDDLDADSGAFGEVVSAGVVERADGDGYRVADREAVERALAGDASDPTGGDDEIGFSLPSVDRRAAAALAGALLVVVLVRLVSLPSVFRDGAVVLSGNDPYFYRYWVERLVADPETTLGTLPGGVTEGEPLLVATLWLVSEAVGGTRAAVGGVMAWYPVASAVVSAGLLYLLAIELTDDRRVALAAVLLLAVVPGHAMRTSLGFADHHAFDYPWLAVTALSLVTLVGSTRTAGGQSQPSRSQSRRSWRRTALGVAGLGVGIAGQTLAWNASPLLVAPVGLALAVGSVLAVRAGRSPARSLAPALGGAVLGAALAWGGHAVLGWHTEFVAGAPALAVAGGVGAVAVAELAHRTGLPSRALVGGELVAALAGVGLLSVALPSYWNELIRGVTGRLLRDDAIAETQSLFGESFGWLLLFGFVLVLAVPYLAWATRRALDEPKWGPAVAYGWYLLALAAVQIRFVGELATFAALFAGLGFVHLAERVDVARPPAPFDDDADGRTVELPDGRQLGALVVLFLLVAGLGLVQVPVKTSQITISEQRYETAAWMADDADDRGWDHPQNYVFSAWGDNRAYNYVVSGESQSYGYARSNYGEFLGAANATRWYQRLDGRVGYVVAEPHPEIDDRTVAARLTAYGSRTTNASGLAHFRAVHVSEGGDYRVFTLVPGATITGSAEPNATVTVRSEVSVDDASFTYERRAATDANGSYSVTVPYPGTYDVGGDEVRVTEAAVRNGTRVSA